VSATRASGASAGWQQVNISRSRSSGIVLTSSSAPASAPPAPLSASSRASCSARAAERRSARIRSSARLRATVVIHAAGFAGVPSRGQRSRAVA
jgi:hypothetical protein